MAGCDRSALRAQSAGSVRSLSTGTALVEGRASAVAYPVKSVTGGAARLIRMDRTLLNR